MVVICLVGAAGSGKCLVGDYLVRNYNFNEVNFTSLYKSLSENENNDQKYCYTDIGYNSDYNVCDKEIEGKENHILICSQVIDSISKLICKNYDKNYLITKFSCTCALESLRKRPAVVVTAIHASLKVRENIFLSRGKDRSDLFEADKLYEIFLKFTITADKHLYNIGSIEELHNSIDRWNPDGKYTARPSWDIYFMRIAYIASTRTNCIKRRVGTVIVKDFRIISTGYNGTHFRSKNCNEGGCERCADPTIGQGNSLDICECLHAEVNALMEAGRNLCKGATMYITCAPCLGCSKLIAQMDISRLVYGLSYCSESRALKLLQESNIQVVQCMPTDEEACWMLSPRPSHQP